MTNLCVYPVHAHIHVNMHTHVKLGFVALLLLYILYVLESMEKLVHDPTTQKHRILMGQIPFCFLGRICNVEIACS